ncbi:hypothetical protein HDU78_002765 [Chytriomyces hyalinus]|nr:hypothetical protein HDU78_002765 [Chytriomyces hyalinus]
MKPTLLQSISAKLPFSPRRRSSEETAPSSQVSSSTTSRFRNTSAVSLTETSPSPSHQPSKPFAILPRLHFTKPAPRIDSASSHSSSPTTPDLTPSCFVVIPTARSTVSNCSGTSYSNSCLSRRDSASKRMSVTHQPNQPTSLSTLCVCSAPSGTATATVSDEAYDGPQCNNTSSLLDVSSGSLSPHGTPLDKALQTRFGAKSTLLGTGTFASTYLIQLNDSQLSKCEPLEMKQICAKEVKPGRISSLTNPEQRNQRRNEWIRNTCKEFRIGKRMNHTNIIKTLELHLDLSDTPSAHIILEACVNRDLYSLIAAPSPINTRDADCLLKQMLNGLAYMHASGACHRDLKPENILIARNGCVKLIDFGCAEWTHTELDHHSTVSDEGVEIIVSGPMDAFSSLLDPIPCTRQTTSNAKTCVHAVGSGPYMAPEQYLPASYNGCKVDVWACAIIYLAMVYKSFPWETANARDANFRAYLSFASCQNGAAAHALASTFPFFTHLPAGEQEMTHDQYRARPTLLSQMLEPDADLRVDAASCLKDTWLKGVVICCSDDDGCVSMVHSHS